ncbi:efflux RND transporter periplasmic adaptor subunit [Lutibacter sp.]|uniref:efflux RND transporter periplasmic adaptor subunit n=1 Tax=Lutibacter sp. TaxID=1925666 RepID=UPI0027368063|nr:efflux RND transporter periplasmic adaptor subunit [Lutibacter sp.]MDP3311895.1 efflux RND transporter periplasmic adaptor subunit [Lutibacter sp.]
MKKYNINIVLFIGFLALFSACNSSEKAEVIPQEKDTSSTIEITTAQFKSAKMELGSVSTQSFIESIKINGLIDVPPANRAMVSAVMGGYIKKIPLLIGDNVQKGQLLFTIENLDFIEIQQNYLKTSEELMYLKSEYERQKTLFDEKITSQKSYLKAESDYKSARALVNGLDQKLRMLNVNPTNVKAGKITSVISVFAPISGSITAVYGSVGKFMSDSDAIIEIINNTHIHLELVVFEKDVLKIKKGQVIKFNIPESSAITYDAEVHLVGKSIDANRTVKVHGHLHNEKENFLVGMFVEAEIITDLVQKTALPATAVIEKDELFYVLMLKEEKKGIYLFEKTKIEVGVKNENWIEVIIPEEIGNKKILIKGAFLPVD